MSIVRSRIYSVLLPNTASHATEIYIFYFSFSLFLCFTCFFLFFFFSHRNETPTQDNDKFVRLRVVQHDVSRNFWQSVKGRRILTNVFNSANFKYQLAACERTDFAKCVERYASNLLSLKFVKRNTIDDFIVKKMEDGVSKRIVNKYKCFSL